MKNKKSIAMAMTAVSTFGATVPVLTTTAFANETTKVTPVASTKPEVNVALTEGNNVDVMNYGRVYDTHFTADKKDDTVKAGLTILDVISNEEGKESYVVATKRTIEDLGYDKETTTEEEKKALEAKLAKQIATEKNELEKTINEIKHNLTLNFINDKGEKKPVYTIDTKKSGEVQAENNTMATAEKRNFYQLVLVNNEDKTETVYHFNNIKVEEKAEEENTVQLKEVTVNLLDAGFNGYASYKELSKYAFELSTAKNIVVEKKEKNPTTLEVKVFMNNEKKTHVGTLTILGMNRFDAKQFVKVSTNGDFAGHWAQNQIADAMINGQVDLADNFRPNDSITRAEFAKIACTVFGIEVDDTNAEPFHDVNNGDWYQKYVAALYSKKVLTADEKQESVVQGDGENFRPNDKITRQEVAVIVAKLVSNRVQDTKTEANVDIDGQTMFKDDASIAPWADQSVMYLNETAKYTNDKGELKPVVEGNNGYFNPTKDITRAEALVMIQRGATATNR